MYVYIYMFYRYMNIENSPVLFWKLKKSALIVTKIITILFIYGSDFSFSMLFLEYFGGKTKFFSAGSFFYVLQMKCLSKFPYSKKPLLCKAMHL